MAEVLTAYLEASTKMHWGWGGYKGGKDCALWMADYVDRLRGGDPAAAFRGKYSTGLGCERIIETYGGLEGLVSSVALSLGLEKTDFPVRGDIGVIETPSPDGRRPTAAICVGQRRWAVFSPSGLLVAPSNHIAAWSV